MSSMNLSATLGIERSWGRVCCRRNSTWGKRIALSLALFSTLLSNAQADSPEPILIGWSGPLTGNSAVLGIDSVPAARMAIEEVNQRGGIRGRPVKLIVEDDQYDTAKAVSAYAKLVAQGVVAVLGSTYGGTFATAKRALSDNVIVINPLDCNNEIAELAENTFCIATESESIGRVIYHDLSERGLLPAGVIYDEKNPFMALVKRVIRESAPAEPRSHFVGVDQGLADFRTVLIQAKSKGVKSLVFLGHDPMGQAMREARGLGITAQFYTLGTITSPGYQQLAGVAANNALVAYWEAPKTEKLKQFHAAFETLVGRPPILELASVPTYDATQLLLAALENSPDPGNRNEVAALKQYLYSVKNYQGLSGVISMDSDGAVRTIRESIYRFNDGKLSNNQPGA